MSLISFDVITTQAVDCFRQVLSDRFNKLREEAPVDYAVSLEKTEALYIYIGRTIAQETAWRLKALLPVCANNFLYGCYGTFFSTIPDSEKAKSIEITTLKNGPALERLNNSEREHTICFRMASNRYYDIALATHTFKDFVCD